MPPSPLAGPVAAPIFRSAATAWTDSRQRCKVWAFRSCSTVEEVLAQVDAVILGAVDGRQHEELAARIFPARLPVFIDKPLAHDYPAACRVAALARQYGTPWFTASALRFQNALTSTLSELQLANEHITGCDAWGTLRTGLGHLELAWYGIHGIEALYAVMGTGCQTVTRCRTECGDLTTGLWPGGRLGTFRGTARRSATPRLWHDHLRQPHHPVTSFPRHLPRTARRHPPVLPLRSASGIEQRIQRNLRLHARCRNQLPPIRSSHQPDPTLSAEQHISCRAGSPMALKFSVLPQKGGKGVQGDVNPAVTVRDRTGSAAAGAHHVVTGRLTSTARLAGSVRGVSAESESSQNT
ncbi:MAG UNVERIFIED_CONTAM: Gfo/Idh/MocA family oxidoreductase [Planctomycetaceae bacterium]